MTEWVTPQLEITDGMGSEHITKTSYKREVS